MFLVSLEISTLFPETRWLSQPYQITPVICAQATGFPTEKTFLPGPCHVFQGPELIYLEEVFPGYSKTRRGQRA